MAGRQSAGLIALLAKIDCARAALAFGCFPRLNHGTEKSRISSRFIGSEEYSRVSICSTSASNSCSVNSGSSEPVVAGSEDGREYRRRARSLFALVAIGRAAERFRCHRRLRLRRYRSGIRFRAERNMRSMATDWKSVATLRNTPEAAGPAGYSTGIMRCAYGVPCHITYGLVGSGFGSVG
jgi:hypothetical protein